MQVSSPTASRAVSSYKSRPITTPAGLAPAPPQPKPLRSRIATAIRELFPPAAGSGMNGLNAAATAHQALPVKYMMIESLEQAPANEEAIVSRLMDSFKAARGRQMQSPQPYLPGVEWKKILETQWERYHHAINRGDVPEMASFLRNFFRNEGLSGFWGGDKMFERFVELDGHESIFRADLMGRQYEIWKSMFPNTPASVLDAPKIGNPWGYVIDGALLYEPVCEYHFQADYFARMLSERSKPVVMEIGGGFGGLAYQIIKRVPGVTYIGLDLPENTMLQGYYLSCAFPELKVLTYEQGMGEITAEMIEAYDIILMPNFMLPQIASASVDLVVNVRSLSEMPADTISEYLQQIDRIGRLYFFHENIYKSRGDGLHGIPTTEFPALSNFLLVAESPSRWPRYDERSPYPCHEHLFLHKSLFSQPTVGR